MLALTLAGISGDPHARRTERRRQTSIFSVASYRLANHLRTASRLLVPLRTNLEFKPDQSYDGFVEVAYYQIALTLVENQAMLDDAGVRAGQVSEIRRWLQSPVWTSQGFNAGGVGAQRGATPSGSQGFTRAGFMSIINDWLDRCEANGSGLVGLIDNLELLRTSRRAREVVEALRDSLLMQPGLWWVLCGTPEVVGGATASSRMQGRIGSPIEVAALPTQFAPDVVRRRLEVFGSPESYAPVDGEEFERLYSILNQHLRYALELCEVYAVFSKIENRRPRGAVERARGSTRGWPSGLIASFSARMR